MVHAPSPLADQHLHLPKLRYLSYYTITTCFTMSRKPSLRHAWQVAIPQEAVSHGHLMYAMLALAAVHLMWTDLPHRKMHERKARHYQSLALTSSIPVFRNITPTKCHTLFATSGIIAHLAFAFQSMSANALASPVDDILDFFTLIRGTKTVLDSARDCIIQGRLKGITEHNWNPKIIPLKGTLFSGALFPCFVPL